MRVKVNSRALGEVLRSPKVSKWLSDVARPIADAAEAHPAVVKAGAKVIVDHYTTDRAVVAVGIDHLNGVGIETKYGVLSGAARSDGLTVTTEHEPL
jgi:hypothetical protein